MDKVTLHQLGFDLVKADSNIGAWVYRKFEDDHEVEINFDGFNWTLHSQSISTHKDWVGQPYHESMGLTDIELRVFMEEMDRLKLEFKY